MKNFPQIHLLLLIAALAGCAAPQEKRSANVLLVSIDTLRGDFLAEAPFLAGLAAEGRSFSRAYASSNWTLPSHLSLLSSLTYSEHGLPPPRAEAPYAGLALPPGQPTLAEVLAAAEYATAATTEGGWLLPRFGLDRGFERFATTRALSAGGTTDFEDHLAFAQTFLSERGDRPFFLFVHTYRVHDYFVNSSEYHDLLLPEDTPYLEWGNLREAVRQGRDWPPKDFVRRLYTAGVHRTDAFLADLVTAVRENSGDAPLLVVVTSDHGESLGEEPGVWGHGHSLSEVQIRVPLVAWSPPHQPGRRVVTGEVDVPVSGVDVAPSILRWLGIEVPETWSGAADRLLERPAPVPVMARHYAEEEGSFRGSMHQLLILEDLNYLRADRYDGLTIDERCLGPAESPRTLAECTPHRRELRRRWARRVGGALRFVSRDPLTLLFDDLPNEVAAVQPAFPGPAALLDSSGRVRWTPEGEGDFLLLYPRPGEIRVSGIEVAEQGVADSMALEELVTKSSFPYSTTGREGALLVLGEGLVATRRGDESEVSPEALEQLRALGYLGD